MTASDDAAAAESLVRTFTALQALLVSVQDVEDFLAEVARLAADVAQPPGSCGITIRRQGQPLTVASSDERAEQVDEVQYEASAGPCLQSLETGAVLDVPDLSAESRWDGYPAHALEHGVHSSLSIPLLVDGSPMGALNLYGSRPHAFDGVARQRAETFAAQAAAALTLVLRNAARAEDRAHLERALQSRSTIDQALGVLMAQQRCSADQAFALLCAHSQNNNRKLRDVAAELVVRVTGQPASPGHPFQH